MVLLERTPALGSVADYLSSATVGNGRLVFIGGEAGVGKTTFVDRVVSDAGPAVRIAYGACDGSSTPAPLGPLREMLPALPGDVWPPDADRAEVFTRLSEVLGRPGTPYLLVVEDAHWADDATLDLLRHLARRVHRLRALVLVTFRTEEAVGSHALRVLFGDVANASGVRRVDLNPLTPDGVRALLLEPRAGLLPVPQAAFRRLEEPELRPGHHDPCERVRHLGLDQGSGPGVQADHHPLDRVFGHRSQPHARHLIRPR